MNRHLLLFLACLSVTSPAWSTSFIARPLPEITQTTPTLVRGKIGPSYADWVKTPAGGKRIYTFYELQISEVFKGDPKAGSTIQVRELGGVKDGVGLEVAGAAQFSAGEDVVLTLGEKNPDGSYDIRGLMTGKYNIGRDQSGNEILIGATGEEIEGAAEDQHGPWTLSEFRKLVASQSRASHSEANTSAAPLSGTPSPSVSAIAGPIATPGPASQLQPDAAQGAAQPSDTGVKWNYAVAVILLLGGVGVGWMTRKKK